jgi:carotenoid cleavage dioxygenase
VLVDGPLVFNLDKSVGGGRPFDFLRGEPLRFGVLPRHGKAEDAVWIDAECCFAYHVVNCWDDPTDPDRCVRPFLRTQRNPMVVRL